MTLSGRVLVVAASDSGGGAGIQADLRTIGALGGFGMTAITALTAQNTLGIFGIQATPPEFVARQMRAVLEDIGADAIKIGMLVNAEIVTAVADLLESPLARNIPVVLDPVLMSSSGTSLLDPAGVEALIARLVPRTALLTPNAPEAAALTGYPVDDLAGMDRAAGALLSAGAHNVLLKGGHLPGDELIDLLAGAGGRYEFRHARIDSAHTHGTGCTLASAIATCLAHGMTLPKAVERAVAYVLESIRLSPGIGGGNGPLGHPVTTRIAS